MKILCVETEWFKSKLIWVALVLGQIVSLLITSTGFSSAELASQGINAPTSQSLLNYVLLAIVYGIYILVRGKPLHAPWYYYLILGIVDVEANYIVVKAYQYTSLTSVMLLDCWTIPTAIFLTWILLKTKYGFGKFAGAAICICGLVTVIFSDAHASDRAKGPDPIKGDLLVVAGSILYGISNVGEEFLVKNADRIETMAMLGVFGAIISGIQISILERDELRAIVWTYKDILPFIGFAVAMFLIYTLVPILLKISGAALLNLSLLSSDMWAILIRIFAFNQEVDWLYFVAFGLVIIGLVLYAWSGRNDKVATVDDENDNQQTSAADEEVGPNLIENNTRNELVTGDAKKS